MADAAVPPPVRWKERRAAHTDAGPPPWATAPKGDVRERNLAVMASLGAHVLIRERLATARAALINYLFIYFAEWHGAYGAIMEQ